MKVFKNATIYVLIILMAIVLIKWSAPPANKDVGMDYNSFKRDVANNQVKDVSGILETNAIKYTVTLKDDTKHEVIGLANDPQLMSDLAEHGLPLSFSEPTESPWWVGLLSTLLPIVAIVGLFFFMMQQSQGGGNRVMQFGKSKARLVGEEKKKVTFADVAGADEVKEELQEVVEFLKFPKKFNELGEKIPTGVILLGNQGKGKNIMARAVSGEAGVPFFRISGLEFVEMFVGVGA